MYLSLKKQKHLIVVANVAKLIRTSSLEGKFKAKADQCMKQIYVADQDLALFNLLLNLLILHKQESRKRSLVVSIPLLKLK